MLRKSLQSRLLLLIAIACSPAPPARPENVPDQAQWTRGVNGRVWVDCDKLAGDQPRYECSIFEHETGTLRARGNFAPNFDPTLIDVALRSYDGAGILKISDTTELRAVDTVDFPLVTVEARRPSSTWGGRSARLFRTDTA